MSFDGYVREIGGLPRQTTHLKFTKTKEICYGNPNPRNDTCSPPIPRRHSRRSDRRPAPAHRRDTRARERDRPSSFAGRAAVKDQETPSFVGHGLRLPEVRREA